MKAMADTAQAASPLFGRMRSTFGVGTVIQPSASPVTPITPASPTTSVLSTESKLDTLEQVLSEVEQPALIPAPVITPSPQQPYDARQQNVGLVAQAAPAAVDQALYQQQVQIAQTSGSTTAKEAFTATVSPTELAATATPTVEAATNIQYVEQEPAPEIPPEVSEYLAHVENHAQQQPQEIVIGEQQQNIPLATNYPKQSVIVLPITPDVEKVGKRKGPVESIRWLVEWSFKMMKAFSGRIIYRQVESSNS